MPSRDVETRIKESFARRMANVVRRLEKLPGEDDLKTTQDALSVELDKVERELNAMSAADDEQQPGRQERLEAQRERLLARQEGVELKLELRQERYERLAESLEEMKTELAESLSEIGQRVSSSVSASKRWGRSSPSPSSGAAGARKMQDERRKILEMVQQGTIGADDAAQLLDALRDQEESERRHRRKPRWVRIRVTDSSNTVRVNLTLPVGLVRAGLRAGGSIAGVEGLDTAGLEEMLDRGETGRLLEIRDEDDGERVEIIVE
jgi:hypothetical protein